MTDGLDINDLANKILSAAASLFAMSLLLTFSVGQGAQAQASQSDDEAICFLCDAIDNQCEIVPSGFYECKEDGTGGSWECDQDGFFCGGAGEC